MLCNFFGGEISNELQLVILRDLPHTYSYTYLCSKENKSGNKGLCRFWMPGSLNFIESEKVIIWSTKFYFILLMFIFYIFYIFYFILSFLFFHGKLNMIDNLRGWRHETRIHEMVGYLTGRTHQAMNKNTRVNLHIHEAKFCICSAWFVVYLSSLWTKERWSWSYIRCS